MTVTLFLEVIGIAARVSGKPSAQWTAKDAVDQDLCIYGDDADDLVEALCDEFGDWLLTGLGINL